MKCGATDYWAIGRTKETRLEYPCLSSPHKLKELQDKRICYIAAGSAACHSVAIDEEGTCYVWGRNEKGQLGLGDQLTRNVPTELTALKGKVKVVAASCGRHHTIFITDKGEAYASGCNSSGQCGQGSVKKVKKGDEDLLLEPVKCPSISNCTKVACGAEFTMWLCDGSLYSAGLPQYGQLGHGTDNQYNAADSSVKMVFDPQPEPTKIASLEEKTVTQVACGHNHTICVCSDGGVWTWGFGGYGRLGHKVQQDEMRPRLVETLTGRIQVPADATVAAGGTSTFCTMVGGQLFAWGKLKVSGDNLMYPVPYMDLAGWHITSMSCGHTTFGVAASVDGEKSGITWGAASYGELGYGEGGKKSSANPDKCMALEGATVMQVAMGAGHSLFLVDSESDAVKNAPVYAAFQEIDNKVPATKESGAAGKKRGRPAGGAKGRPKK